MGIVANISRVKQRIHDAAQRSNRDVQDITIVAVSKTMPVESIQEALHHGISIIGENRVQEAKEKHAVLKDQAVWHMVGHLQTNKVKDALAIFSLIHSLDSLHLAREIEKRATGPVECLIEVNTSGEKSKYGIEPREVAGFYDSLKQFRNILVKGLMTIGPGWAIEDPEASRSCFHRLRQLNEELSDNTGTFLPILSMGMTSDFEIAIEEGSTMVRIGTAIFGPRESRG